MPQISGVPEISLHLKTNDIGRDNLPVTAVLLDTCDKEFPAFGPNDFEPTRETIEDKSFEFYPGQEGIYLSFVRENTKAKVISSTCFDLYNPGQHKFGEHTSRVELEEGRVYEYQAYFEPATYTLEKGHTLKCILYTFDPGLLSKSAYFADEEGEEYDPTGDVFYTPYQWANDESYGYALDSSHAPILSLPIQK